tara:strand:- start:2942 stop:3235 length:294 start_codon:yes stop_codon:yes gene_type:complete
MTNNLVTKASELIYQMDQDQLNQTIEAIKLKRTHLAKQATRSMMIGDIVGFTGKRGNQVSGKVTKIAKKYVTVDCGANGSWRVPGNHLTKLGIGEEA